MVISNTQHFKSFYVIFVCFLPLLVGFCHTFLFFSHFCLFFSHLSSNLSISRTVWQDSWSGQLGTAAWQNTCPPLAGRNFGRKGLKFGRMKVLAPPKKWPRYAYAVQCTEQLLCLCCLDWQTLKESSHTAPTPADHCVSWTLTVTTSPTVSHATSSPLPAAIVLLWCCCSRLHDWCCCGGRCWDHSSSAAWCQVLISDQLTVYKLSKLFW